LFSIEFGSGTDRLAEDPIGDRPSETYARLISESRAVALNVTPSPEVGP
jgi:hypothetical protein